jgi:hypothetical protein
MQLDICNKSNYIQLFINKENYVTLKKINHKRYAKYFKEVSENSHKN